MSVSPISVPKAVGADDPALAHECGVVPGPACSGEFEVGLNLPVSAFDQTEADGQAIAGGCEVVELFETISPGGAGRRSQGQGRGLSPGQAPHENRAGSGLRAAGFSHRGGVGF